MKKALKIVGIVLLVFVVGLAVAIPVMASRFEAGLSAPGTPYPEVVASSDPEVVARGEYLVRTVGHCSQCHGAYERMNPTGNTRDVPLSGGFAFDMEPLATLYSANLTPDKETGLGRRTDREVARLLASGVGADGLVSPFMRFASKFSAEDLVAVVSYLRSLPPVKREVPPAHLSMLGRAAFSMLRYTPELGPPPKHVPPPPEPTIERGAYLAENVSLCITCHTTYDPLDMHLTGPRAGGGVVEPSHGTDTDMEYAPPNLTSDPTGVTGRLDEDAFVARFRLGRAHASSIMPWENLARATDVDLRSIYRYLRSLPPVANDVGPTYRPRGWSPSDATPAR